MRCPFCLSPDSRVVDSREITSGEAIRRRRECQVCKRRFTTYERFDTANMMVVKKDGRREEFNAQKLREKLRISLTKRPIGEAQLDKLIDRVEGEMLALGTREVESSVIGELVLQELKQLDQVAYVRFASVYREFADLEDMRRELDELNSK
jgi:transcriptional repressor NrdR